MSNIQLRNSDNDPYLYLEANTTGSAVVGIDTTGNNNIVKICTGLVDNIDPTSVTASISIDPAANGNITISPKGIGETIINNGDLVIQATGGSEGNLLMVDTTTGGQSGVIEFGAQTMSPYRFIHNYGINNTFVGEVAGNTTTIVGTDNVGIGYNTLSSLDFGSSNTAIGSGALVSATSALNNVAIGNGALAISVADSDNTAVGINALATINGGIQNTAVGSGALSSFQSSSNTTAVGFNALHSLAAGSNNTAIGYQALAASQNDSNNTAVGYNALSSLNGGLRNTAVGTNALAASTTDSNNTAIGYNALASMNGALVTGNSVAIGENCLASSVQDYSNIGIGLNALASLNGGGSFSNVAIGIQTLPSLTSGNNNMTMGYQTGYNLLTGHDNVMIGDNSGFHYTGAESNNILFNNLGVLGESNAIRIGTGSTTCNIAGIYGNAIVSPQMVAIDSSGNLGSQAIPGGGGFSYTDETSSPITLVVNNGYTANLGTLLTFNMPASVAYGSVFKILGKGTGLWSVVLSGGQTIVFGVASGTTSISSTLQYDCVEIVCITADTLFQVVNSIGNLTIV